MVIIMPNVTWLEGSYVETVKGWQSGWFYITEPRDTNWVATPEFRSGIPMRLTSWKEKGLSWGCGADRTSKMCQEYDKQENQACQRGPGQAPNAARAFHLPPNPPVSKTGIQYVGV